MPGFLIAITVYIISFLVPRTVPDPDLEIRGGGGGDLQKNFSRPFEPPFGLKIGGPRSPGPLPWIHH